MLEKVKEYLYIDGNAEDTVLSTLINASKAYIENSLKDKSNIETVRLDERYELLTLMLTAHFYNNRGVSIETAVHTVPHGVYPLMRQLDAVKGETPVEPVDPDEPLIVKINGADYEYVSRTATSITLAETETVPTITSPFVNIDGVDYAYNGTQGSTVSFFNLSDYNILNENETLYGLSKGYSRMVENTLFIKTFEDLTGKLVMLFDELYELTQASVYTFTIEPYEAPPVEPEWNDEVDVRSVSTNALIDVVEAYVSLPTMILDGRSLSSDEYYQSGWGEFPGIYVMDTSTTIKPYVSPTYDFNTDYKIVDGTTIIKRNTNQTAHTFIYEDFEYTLSNPRNYIDHTIFDYVAVPYEAPVEPEEPANVIEYEVYMNYEHSSNPSGWQPTGTGSGLLDAVKLTLTRPSFIVGLEHFVDYYADTTRLIHDTTNDVWYTTGTPTGPVVELTPYTITSSDKFPTSFYKPRIQLLTSSLTNISLSTAEQRQYTYSHNTGFLQLNSTPNRQPGRLRSPEHTSTTQNLRFLLTVNGTYSQAVSSSSDANLTNRIVKSLDFEGNVIGAAWPSVAVGPTDTSAQLAGAGMTWLDHRATHIEVPGQGVKTITAYDLETNTVSWA